MDGDVKQPSRYRGLYATACGNSAVFRFLDFSSVGSKTRGFPPLAHAGFGFDILLPNITIRCSRIVSDWSHRAVSLFGFRNETHILVDSLCWSVVPQPRHVLENSFLHR